MKPLRHPVARRFGNFENFVGVAISSDLTNQQKTHIARIKICFCFHEEVVDLRQVVSERYERRVCVRNVSCGFGVDFFFLSFFTSTPEDVRGLCPFEFVS